MGTSTAPAGLAAKVDAKWVEVNESGEIARLKCWGILLEDEELARLMGSGDGNAGRLLLKAMKQAKALDISGDNIINESEFKRLYMPTVIAAALKKVGEIRAKVDTMWAAGKKDDKGGIERLACWEYILADEELPGLVAFGDADKGKEMLLAMKSAKALDVSGDGQITQDEFVRLFDPAVICTAEKAA